MEPVFRGITIPPYYRVLPPGGEDESRGPDGPRRITIRPSAAFGTGTHETTQLCLLALGYFLRTGFRPENVLDFGAGTGILAIAAALSGARVEAVEIDQAALESARENAELNSAAGLVDLRAQMSEPPRRFDLVLANILAQVLLDHAEALCARLSPSGRMVLSGLVGTDVPSILARYRPLLGPMRTEVYERGEWRAVVFAAG